MTLFSKKTTLHSREDGDQPLFTDALFNFVPGSAFEIGTSLAILDHPGKLGMLLDSYAKGLAMVLIAVYCTPQGDRHISASEPPETLKERFDRKIFRELHPNSDQLGRCLQLELATQWDLRKVNWLCEILQTNTNTSDYTSILTKIRALSAFGGIIRDLTILPHNQEDAALGQTMIGALINQSAKFIQSRTQEIKTALYHPEFNDKKTRACHERIPKIDGQALTDRPEIKAYTTDAGPLRLGFGQVFHASAMQGDASLIDKYNTLEQQGRQRMPRVGQDIHDLSRLGIFGESSLPLIPRGFIRAGLLEQLRRHSYTHGTGINRWQLTGTYAIQSWDNNMPAAGCQSAQKASFLLAANCLSPHSIVAHPDTLALGLLISAYMNAGGYHSFIETFPITQAIAEGRVFKATVAKQHQQQLYQNMAKVVHQYAGEKAWVQVNEYMKIYRSIMRAIGHARQQHDQYHLNHFIKQSLWKVPTIYLERYIGAKEKQTQVTFSSGEVVDISDFQYTILDDKGVVFRNVHELAELIIATKGATHPLTKTPVTPIDLVSFRPERIALHEIIATIITKVQYIPTTPEEEKALEHDVIFLRIANHVLNILKDDITCKARQLMNIRCDLEEKITQFLKGNATDNTFFTSIIIACESMLNHDGTFGQHVPGYSIHTALIALATDMAYKTIATREMKELVEERIEQLITEKQLTALVPPQPHERELFLVAGGHGSGKGSAFLILKYSAEYNDIAWSNVSKGGGDTFRTLLLKHGDVHPELYSQLSSPEASYISHTVVKSKLIALSHQNKAPHIFIEQLYLGEDKLQLALHNGGNAHIIFVSTAIEVALERAFKRGLATGRYEHVSGVLSAHRGSTMQLPQRMKESRRKPVYVLIVDNNGAQGTSPVPVASIDCLNEIIKIFDSAKLLDFIKKTAINVHATSLNTCYDEAKLATLSIDDYFHDLDTFIIEKDCCFESGEANEPRQTLTK